MTNPVSRRAAMAGIGAAAALAGCTTYDQNGPRSTAPGTPQQTGPTKIGATADVPVGGGAVFAEAQTVVTQPQAGTFKGFTAVCTHQGCIVANVAGGTINCNCHGSSYKVADGSVATGPATRALAEKQLKIEGGSIFLA